MQVTELKAARFADCVSHGSLYISALADVERHPELLPYAHYLRQAWRQLDLAGVLCVDNRPVVYLCEAKRFTDAGKRQRHAFVWNQGLVPLLLFLTPSYIEIHSGVRLPPRIAERDEPSLSSRTLISNFNAVEQTLDCASFVRSVETGQFFHDHADFFPANESVDRCLVANLVYTAKQLKGAGWKLDRAHALLGRTLFVSFLHQREFIKPHHFPEGTRSLLDILRSGPVSKTKRLLYDEFFGLLRREFNGTMFDRALDIEARDIRATHLEILRRFLSGEEMESGQLMMFPDYDFGVIPVETISALYEEFMKEDDLQQQRKDGAFYTPRHLAETTLHIALEGHYSEASTWRVLDPACGSGIFLVAIFNLLAAQWLRENASSHKQTKAQGLLDILQRQICGVDINSDACRIAAFSLYLALFEKLHPIDLDEFKLKVRVDNFLPPLVWSDQPDGNISVPVLINGNFFSNDIPLDTNYDLVIGNPPWESRGDKQIALKFAHHSVKFIRESGFGCLLLPTTILVNRYGILGRNWFSAATVEKIVQLADFRRVLFEATHPCFIMRYRKAKPTLDQTIAYETPKLNRFDRRRGVIAVEPDDQKTVEQREITEAALANRLQDVWLRRFWGTPRDEAFLRRLRHFPKLSALVGPPSEKKRWTGGVGFQPYFPGHYTGNTEALDDWSLSDNYLANTSRFPHLVVTSSSLQTLGEGLKATRHRESKVGASLTHLRRKPPEAFFSPPLVIYSKGFTKFAFCGEKIRFQDGLRSICGPKSDADLLRFLVAALSSELFAYISFHSGSSIGVGRDQLHVYETLNLPFMLATDELAPSDASDLVDTAARIMRKLEKDLATNGWTSGDELLAAAQDELNPIVESFFRVSQNERFLIEDTLALFGTSIHPTRIDAEVPALVFPDSGDRKLYADTLCTELNRFGRKERIRASAHGMASSELGLIFITVTFGADKLTYHETANNSALWKALAGANKAAQRENGRFLYLRGFTYCERDRIHILKPATLRNWCRTAALNDADAMFEYLSAGSR